MFWDRTCQRRDIANPPDAREDPERNGSEVIDKGPSDEIEKGDRDQVTDHAVGQAISPGTPGKGLGHYRYTNTSTACSP